MIAGAPVSTYDGTSLIAASKLLTPLLNSGATSATGGSIALPFSSAGVLVDRVSVNSEATSATGATVELTPPVYSGASATVGGVVSFTPPLKSEP